MFVEFKRQIFCFLFIWGCVAVWQLFLMFLMFGSFFPGLFPTGMISYVFSAGYLFCHVRGSPIWGPMGLSDWRWVAGMVAMLCLSGLAVFPQNNKCRFAAKLLFVVLHLAGSFCTFINMGSVIT